VADGPVSAAERAVLDRISRDEIIELTRSLVGAPGTNPPGAEEATVSELFDACTARGLECSRAEVEPGRPNLSATFAGADGPGLLLLGHTDVVPIGTGWTVDPLGGLVRDGRLFGRGSTDMLGGLAACVVAMAALREAGVELSGPVELAAVVDEEETGKGVRHFLTTRERPDFLGCVVAEPTDVQTVLAARGDSYVEVTVRGRAAHAGNPADGANAIYGAAAVVAELESWNHELARTPHRLIGPATWSVGQVRGGTGTSTVPAECVLVADRRLLPEESAAEVVEALSRRVASLALADRGLAAEVRVTMEMPGFETAADHPFVTAVDGAVGAAGGPGLPLGGWTAACDGGFVARATGVPVVVLGPGSVGDQAHQPDESVDLEELHVASRAYALAALRLLRVG